MVLTLEKFVTSMKASGCKLEDIIYHLFNRLNDQQLDEFEAECGFEPSKCDGCCKFSENKTKREVDSGKGYMWVDYYCNECLSH